eukprot:gene17210-17034_t
MRHSIQPSTGVGTRHAGRAGRLVIGIAASVLVALPATIAMSQEKPSIRQAYQTAIRCFVVNGHVSLMFKRKGDTANAQLFDGKARTAHDAAKGYALFLKLAPNQISRDMDATTDAELRRLLAEPGYLTEAAKACKAASLM